MTHISHGLDDIIIIDIVIKINDEQVYYSLNITLWLPCDMANTANLPFLVEFSVEVVNSVFTSFFGVTFLGSLVWPAAFFFCGVLSKNSEQHKKRTDDAMYI